LSQATARIVNSQNIIVEPSFKVLDSLKFRSVQHMSRMTGEDGH